MTRGIYCYKDTENNDKIVYIGKDSHIDKDMRHKDHTRPSRYDEQVINRIVQNNPLRYKYEKLKEFDGICDELLNITEILYIGHHKPKFNFTKGGEGIKGFKYSDEMRRKLRENHPKGMKGKHHSEDSRKRIGEAQKGKLNYNYRRHFSEEERLTMSNSRTSTGIYRVMKQNYPNSKQGFSWRYVCYNNGKFKTIESVDVNKLKEKVLAKGLEWIILDEEKAKSTGVII